MNCSKCKSILVKRMFVHITINFLKSKRKYKAVTTSMNACAQPQFRVRHVSNLETSNRTH